MTLSSSSSSVEQPCFECVWDVGIITDDTLDIPSNDIALCWDMKSSWMHYGGDSDSMGCNLPGELKSLVMIVGDPCPGGWVLFPMGGLAAQAAGGQCGY